MLEKVLRLLPYAVTATLLGAIAWTTDGFALLGTARWPWIAAAGAVSLGLNVGLASFKLWLLLRWFGVAIPGRRMVRMILGLQAATFFMPFQSGHLLYAVALRATGTLDTRSAVECVVYDKLLTLLGTLLLVGVGFFLLPADHVLARPWIPALAFAAVSVLWLGGPLRRVLGRFPRLADRSLVLARPLGTRRKLVLLGLAAVYQTSDVVTMGLACAALGLDVDLRVVAGAVPVVILASWIPVTVSGLGLRENLVAFVFAGRIAWDAALAAGLLIDAVEYALPAIVGSLALPWLIRAMRRGPAPAPRP